MPRKQGLHFSHGRAGELGEGVFVGRIFKHAREGCEVQCHHPGWRRAECRLAAAGARQQPRQLSQRLRYLRGRCGFVQHRWHWRGVSRQRLKLWCGSVMLFGRIAHGGRTWSGVLVPPCRHALQNADLRRMISSSHFLRRSHQLISTPQTNGPSKLTFKSELRERIGVGSSTRILSSNRVNVSNAGETYRHPTVGRLQHSKSRNGRLLPVGFSEF